MSWRDLLEPEAQDVVVPWTGASHVRVGRRRWAITTFPPEHGWCTFAVRGREARFMCAVEREGRLPALYRTTRAEGYLFGDRLIPDGVDANAALSAQAAARWERVALLDPDALTLRFARVVAARDYEGGPLIFVEQLFPADADTAAREAFDDGRVDALGLRGATPALCVAFAAARLQQRQAEARRRAAEAAARAEEEARQREERRQGIIRQLGDAAGRRAMAALDFETAARHALAIGGATLISVRPEGTKHQVRLGNDRRWVVRYRVAQRRLECVCDERMRIVDAGVCLRDHDTGAVGDTLLTLESLPSVIMEAIRLDCLVVWRHV